MYQKFYTKQFQKSVKKIIHSGLIKRKEIESVINILSRGTRLPENFRNHGLTGEFMGYHECHIRPDILLVYKIEQKGLILILADIGSHSKLFK